MSSEPWSMYVHLYGASCSRTAVLVVPAGIHNREIVSVIVLSVCCQGGPHTHSHTHTLTHSLTNSHARTHTSTALLGVNRRCWYLQKSVNFTQTKVFCASYNRSSGSSTIPPHAEPPFYKSLSGQEKPYTKKQGKSAPAQLLQGGFQRDTEYYEESYDRSQKGGKVLAVTWQNRPFASTYQPLQPAPRRTAPFVTRPPSWGGGPSTCLLQGERGFSFVVRWSARPPACLIFLGQRGGQGLEYPGPEAQSPFLPAGCFGLPCQSKVARARAGAGK